MSVDHSIGVREVNLPETTLPVEVKRVVDVLLEGPLSKPSQKALDHLVIACSAATNVMQQWGEKPSSVIASTEERLEVNQEPGLRYNGASAYPDLFNDPSEESLGRLRELPPSKERLEFLSTPQIEVMIEALGEIWHDLERRRQAKDSQGLNYSDAQWEVLRWSHDLANEWKGRVNQGSPTLSFLRRFYPQIPPDTAIKTACHDAIMETINENDRVKVETYYKDTLIQDPWIKSLCFDQYYDVLPYVMKDPFAMAVGAAIGKFGLHESGSFSDSTYCDVLGGFTQTDLSVISQWIHDLNAVETVLESDFTKLKALGVQLEREDVRYYFRNLPEIRLYSQLTYKLLSKEGDWREFVSKVVTDNSMDTDHKNYLLLLCGSLVTHLAPFEAYKIAEKTLNQVIEEGLNVQEVVRQKVGTLEWEITSGMIQAAMGGDTRYSSLMPLVANLHPHLLNRFIGLTSLRYDSASWEMDDDIDYLIQDSASRQWSSMSETERSQDEYLAIYILNNFFKTVAGKTLSSYSKWALEKPSNVVNLGHAGFNLQVLQQSLDSLPKSTYTYIAWNQERDQSLDMLADLPVGRLTALFHSLYETYWRQEHESMLVISATSGQMYWATAPDALQARAGLVNKKEAAGYDSVDRSYSEPYSFPKQMDAAEVKGLIGSSPEIEGNYYVLPMNKYIRFMTQRIWQEILKADPATFEREFGHMLKVDDGVSLPAKIDLLSSCNDPELYFGSLKELAFLRESLATFLEQAGLEKTEVADYSGALLPLGFGISDTAAVLARQRPDQYYATVRKRLETAILPTLQLLITSQAEPVRSFDKLSGVHHKSGQYPIDARLEDIIRYGQYEPGVMMTMIGRLLDSQPTVHKKQSIFSLDGRTFARASAFPFTDEYLPQDERERKLVYGLRALQLNYFIWQLREGTLPEHIRRQIFPKTETSENCLIPDYRSIARPLQRELYEKYTAEIEEKIRAALYKNSGIELTLDGSGPTPTKSDVIQIKLGHLSIVPQELAIDQPLETVLKDEMTEGEDNVIMVANKRLSLPKLTADVLPRIEGIYTPEELANLVRLLHASLSYWFFSPNPSSETAAGLVNKLSRQPIPETELVNTIESCLENLLRFSGEFDEKGRLERYQQMMETNQDLNRFTTSLLGLLKSYLERL